MEDKNKRSSRIQRGGADGGRPAVSYTAGAQIGSHDIRKIAGMALQAGAKELYDDLMDTADALDTVVREMPAVFVFVESDEPVEGAVDINTAADILCTLEDLHYKVR